MLIYLQNIKPQSVLTFYCLLSNKIDKYEDTKLPSVFGQKDSA